MKLMKREGGEGEREEGLSIPRSLFLPILSCPGPTYVLEGRGGAIFVRYATVGQFTKNVFSSFSESAGRQTN